MNALTRFDTTALQQLNRAIIGFDRLFADRAYSNQTYPPYNVVKHGEDSYEIEVAVAGFKLSEIDLELRREGDVLGANQSGGRSSLKLLRVIRDAELIQEARKQAEQILLADPTLEKNPQLAAALAQLEESAQDNLSKN